MKKNLFILLTLLTLALAIRPENHLFLFPTALLLTVMVEPKALRIFLNWKFLVFIVFLIVGVPLFAAEKDATVWKIGYSSQLLASGITMSERSIIILLGIKFFTKRISISDMSNALEKVKLVQFSRVFKYSMDALPEIREITVQSFKERPASSNRIHIFRNIYESVIQLVVQVILYAENFSKSHSKQDISNESESG